LTLTNIPKNKFASLFVKFTGVSFIHYVNHLRLEHAAKMLLEHPEYTIETIAIDSGIPKTQTFYRLFFKEYGVTPSVYREQQKALLNDK
jgi:AraC-like DNA-binding protein